MDDPRMEARPPTAESAEKPLLPTQRPLEDSLTTGKGVKETIESILIAFILAFVFRAFVVEAFVIPTGSMATTLLGAHMRFTCRECGYVFDVSYQSERSSSGDDIEIPTRYGAGRAVAAYCPNCRFKVPAPDCIDPFIRYGDRILVLKYQYILSPPRRWDVVVFKTPEYTLPRTPLYTINYIKRLVGLPNEKLMVLFGDVYVASPPGSDSDSKTWKIQTKPRYAQDALWRIIYDHDYRPQENTLIPIRTASNQIVNVVRGDDGWRLPWVHGSNDGWDTGDQEKSRVMRFANLAGSGTLRFDHTAVPGYKDKSLRAPGGYFTDWMAYDVSMHGPDYTVYTVSDLRLCFSYQRLKGDGPLRAQLTKLNDKFALEIAADRVRLIHELPGGRKVELPALAAFDPSAARGPIRVDFSNADYQVSVRLNDELIFQTTDHRDPRPHPPEQEYEPNVAELLARYHENRSASLPVPSVTIEASKQEATLSHVSLWRDVYYTPQNVSSQPLEHASPESPIELGSDEYFVMGDNSAGSSDARYWSRDIHLEEENLFTKSGRVPGRFMLGRAFFVYWPAGYRPLEREGVPALIPDFGEMRLIH